jgi:hypothetical protein
MEELCECMAWALRNAPEATNRPQSPIVLDVLPLARCVFPLLQINVS